jgi:hypothetical protein
VRIRSPFEELLDGSSGEVVHRDGRIAKGSDVIRGDGEDHGFAARQDLGVSVGVFPASRRRPDRRQHFRAAARKRNALQPGTVGRREHDATVGSPARTADVSGLADVEGRAA